MRWHSVSERKKEATGCMFVEQKLDGLALCETEMKGKGECDFGSMSGMMSGVIRGRAREGVAIFVTQFVADIGKEWKEVSSRVMWIRLGLGKSRMFVSAFGQSSEGNEEEREDFWSSLDECLQSFGRNANVVVLDDLNARVGDGCINAVVRKFGVPGRNERGESLIAMCLERELRLGNTICRKKDIFR